MYTNLMSSMIFARRLKLKGTYLDGFQLNKEEKPSYTERSSKVYTLRTMQGFTLILIK